jgi:hypothetical protein
MPEPVRYPLDETGHVTLDALGNGTVRLQPRSSRETWVVDGAAVSQVSAVAIPAEPECNVYNSTLASKLGGTFTGSQDQIGLNVTVRGGFIMAVWTGGEPGAQCTLNLTGQRIMTRA